MIKNDQEVSSPYEQCSRLTVSLKSKWPMAGSYKVENQV